MAVCTHCNFSILKELIRSFHAEVTFLPEKVYTHHPSVLCMSLLTNKFEDQQCPRHALGLALAALKSNGSRGIYTTIKSSDKQMLEFHSKMGLFDIPVPNEPGSVLMGRVV